MQYNANELGHIVSQMAHNWCNASACAVANAELIKYAERLGVNLSETVLNSFIDDMIKRLTMALEMAQAFVAFEECWRNEANVDELIVGEILEGVVRERQGEWGSAICWENRIASGFTAIGAPLTLRSLFGHVVRNAVEARDDTSDRTHKISAYLENSLDCRRVLVIEDNGQGMSEEVARRATEPFFSTKQGHVGVGLTLVNGMWRSCGGSLEIVSRSGGGTKIKLIQGRYLSETQSDT